MYNLIKLFFVVFTFVLLLSPMSIKAQQGCCSWHGGVAGCSNGRTLCADGTLSPSCTCDSSYEYEAESNNEGTGWRKIIAIVIIVGGWLGFGYILTFVDDYKKRKKEEIEEKERLELERLHLEQKESELNNIKELKSKFLNGENMVTLVEYLNGRITSDDVIDIIKNDENDNVKILLDELYKKICSDKYYIKENDIFNNICIKIINSDLLEKKKKIIEYIFASFDYDYGRSFMVIINTGNYSFAKDLLKKLTSCRFLFNEREIEKLFYNIHSVNEIELADLISRYKGFIYEFNNNTFAIFKCILEEKDKEMLEIYCKIFQSTIYCLPFYVSEIIDVLTKMRDVTLVKYYLEQCNDNETFMKEYGFELIYLSIKRLNIEIIEFVLTTYKNINLDKMRDGMTPLMYACYRKSYRTVKALLDYGVDINYVDDEGYNALAYACDGESLKTCKLLLERGCVVDFPDYMEKIEYAIKKNETYLLPHFSIRSIYLLKKRKH